jgi:hypothetical protein
MLWAQFFVIPISSLFRHSKFGFRHSDNEHHLSGSDP